MPRYDPASTTFSASFFWQLVLIIFLNSFSFSFSNVYVCSVPVTGPGYAIDLTFDGTLPAGKCYENIYLTKNPVLPGPNKCCDLNNPLFVLDKDFNCCLQIDLAPSGFCPATKLLNIGPPDCSAYFPTSSGPWATGDSATYVQLDAWCSSANIPNPPLSIPPTTTPTTAGPPFVLPKFPKNLYSGIKPNTAVVLTNPDSGNGIESFGSTVKYTLNLDVGVYQLAFNYAIPSFGVNYADLDQVFLDVLVFNSRYPDPTQPLATIVIGSQPFSFPPSYNSKNSNIPLTIFHTQLTSVDWVSAKTIFFEVTTPGFVILQPRLNNYSLPPGTLPKYTPTTAAVGLVNFTLLKVINPAAC